MNSDPEELRADAVGTDTEATSADTCPSCQAMAEEIVRLEERLARAEARARELSFAALEVAHPEGTPIGDAVREPDFATLGALDQRMFVELMAKHFPIQLDPSEAAWIFRGIKGNGDPQFKINVVDAAIHYLGGRRILDEVARSPAAAHTQEFDREYVESVAGVK